MNTFRKVLYLVAVLCGITAMGCWVLTQADAAIRKEDAPRVFLIMLSCSGAFLCLLLACAYLSHKASGLRSVVGRMLFMVGTGGLIAVLFYGAVSRGVIFRFGALPIGLLICFSSLALIFRTSDRQLPVQEDTGYSPQNNK